MIERNSAAPVFGAVLLAASAVLLGGCGKKEQPQESPSPMAPTAQAPAPVAPAPAAPAGQATGSGSDAEAAMKKSDCFTCHAVDKKVVGPAYSWVAYRYKDNKEAVAKLVAKVKKGGMGDWNAYTGGVVMTPHPQLSDDEIKVMVEWVLSRPPVEPPKV